MELYLMSTRTRTHPKCGLKIQFCDLFLPISTNTSWAWSQLARARNIDVYVRRIFFFAVFCCEEVQIYRVVYFYCKVKKRKAALLSSNISTVVKILYYTRRWMSAIMAKIHVNPQGFYPKPLSKYF